MITLIALAGGVERLVQISKEVDEKAEVFGLCGSERGERENIFRVGGEETSGVEKLVNLREKIVSFHAELKRGLGNERRS